MKKICFILILFTYGLFAEELYLPDRVIQMELNFYDENYLYLLEQNKDDKIDIPAQLIVDNDLVIDSVGVRYKGNSSYNVKGKKKSFNVSIDAFIPDQRLYGYKTLNLNNGFVDPTFMREKITTEIFGKYIPTIKSGYVYLYINGEEYGLYTNVQQLNKDFLSQHYSSKSGNLYKGDPRGNLLWQGSSLEKYNNNYEKKTNEEEDNWSDLINLIDVVNNSTDLENQLPDIMNTDRTLWYFALCNAFVNLDSYILSGHNYYLYNVPTVSKFDILPWDLNEAFGVFPPSLPFPKEEFPPIDKNAPNRLPLYKNMLSKHSFRNIYYAHYRTILDEFFNLDTIRTIIDRIKPVIQDYVKRDPLKLYSYEAFEKNINEDVYVEKRLVPGLLSFIKKRKKYLLRFPEFTQNPPVVENVECLTEEIFPGEKAVFNTTVRGNIIKKVTLFYKFGDNPFSQAEMFDDGLHSDGVANDNKFGVTIDIPADVNSEKIDYYIMAIDADNMMKFEPERAEFEFHSETIIQNDELGNVVINEFMASNKTIIQDPQGSYADWIELYNRSESDVNLKGWYLTDDPAEIKKWQFPDVVIKSFDYIIIWADKDVEDEGIHTNFKLSKDGEYIGLYNEAGEMIDSYTFGEQTTDVSEGRYPNGIGDFVFMDMPTPLTENRLSTGINNRKILEVNITPNPVSDYLIIESSEPYSKLEIYNILGLQVKQSGYSQVVNLSGLDNGVYFVKIYSGQEVKTIKIVKIN